MARKLKDWLTAFLAATDHAESGRFLRFWGGVSAIAGALRRKVCIDMDIFKWTPNFFIIVVAPPGVASKSTNIGLAMDLLRAVPGIHFGPDVVTAASLAEHFENNAEAFMQGEYLIPMSALTLFASEFGLLMDFDDRGMVNLMIDLWDGRPTFYKTTKNNGNNLIEGPWINIAACTTPAWISANMSHAIIGGGFTSRCIFVYVDKKEKLIAYPKKVAPEGRQERTKHLIDDLIHISTELCGEYELDPTAIHWGTEWYEKLWSPESMADDTSEQQRSYRARKQTHLHKLAMIIAASSRDELVITAQDLKLADQMLKTAEADMPKVFAQVGCAEAAKWAEELISMVIRAGEISYEEAFRRLHRYFPGARDFEDMVVGTIKSGQLELVQSGSLYVLKAKMQK